ncbi:AAA family ATPase [Rhizophagus clarus]|uniref:AAA family ATPase n=1 Tax=Rhizophagus clarus TaxID=94130 RepID=A0A8H3L9U1_9GLOM|nr:AAA family ATPase [Rhizophagus clarus]
MLMEPNFILLGETSIANTFTVRVCDINNINGIEVLFDQLKISGLKYLIYDVIKKHINNDDYNDLNLWKTDIAFGDKLKNLTEEQICQDSEQLVPITRFNKYFPDQDAVDKSLIFVQVPATAPIFCAEHNANLHFPALEEEEVTSMTWNHQSNAIKSALIEPPIIIDNGVYSLGESEFKKFVISGTFVDKSLFIMEFMIYGQRAILITRPRRFGKSTNLSMLQTFLSVDYPPLNYIPDVKTSLFGKLKVAKFEWFAKLHYKQWPVIHISFKDLGNESWEQMRNETKERIRDLYRKHRYVISILSEDDKKLFEKVLNGTTEEEYLSNAISRLARYLDEFFGKSSIILIDEYDWPMGNARGFYDKADNFFGIMYSSVAKENSYVHKILFVGILPLRQSSFLSGLNNVVTYPMHERQSRSGRAVFSDTFGFTEEEIKSLLEKKHQNEKLNELRLYYNGYRTSTKVHIYNPHSVISFLEKNEIDNYWINSGSAITLVEYLKKCGSGVKDRLHSIDNIIHSSFSQDQDESDESDESVIGLDVELMPYLLYNDLDTKPEMNALCTLLYYSGYLTMVPGSLTGHTVKNVKLVIPNREIACQWILWIFEVMSMEYAKTNEIYESLFKKDIAKFCNKFPSLYMELICCFDIGDLKRGKLYETWYHILFLGSLAIYHSVEYRVEVNREVGVGRPDLRIIPIVQNKTVSITYEFKHTENDDSGMMKDVATGALDQIFVKDYRMNLPDHVKEIVEVGIAFCDKVAFVSARCLKRSKEGLTTNEDWEVVSEWETGKME